MKGPPARSELTAKFGMEPVHHTLELRVKKRLRGPLRFSRFVRSELLARHPETDAQIEGVVVPQWSACCEQILSIAARLPQIPYVG